MTHAVDEALPVQREDQANGPQPEEGRRTEGKSAEERERQEWNLQNPPHAV
jgi:hypothetical protein